MTGKFLDEVKRSGQIFGTTYPIPKSRIFRKILKFSKLLSIGLWGLWKLFLRVRKWLGSTGSELWRLGKWKWKILKLLNNAYFNFLRSFNPFWNAGSDLGTLEVIWEPWKWGMEAVEVVLPKSLSQVLWSRGLSIDHVESYELNSYNAVTWLKL